ncbi:MAG: sulfatase [Candidatus Hodarchaeota archaeon]
MKIFLIIFDTLRKDHTGKIYGNDWIKTPHFDEFAKDSLIFEKAYPESLPTIPFRRSIHTGIRTFPFNHKLPQLRTDDEVLTPGWDPIPPHHKHLSEYLKSFAYTTAFITSTYHQFKPNMNFHLGFDQWNWIRGHETDKYRARFREGRKKFNKIIDEHIVKRDPIAKLTQKRILRNYFPNVQGRSGEEDYFPAQTFKKSIEFIKDTIKLNNIFCFIDEFDPHEPWDPPQKYLELYVEKDYDGKKIITPSYSENLDYISDEELNYMRNCYAGEVSLCDNWFGYFIEELKNLEIYYDSLIILTSDHGHSIGEHGATGKIPMFMHPELVDIPLIIKPPSNISGPKKIKKPYVYNYDILPTILGFLDKKKPKPLEGIDLSRFTDDPDQVIENRNYITCGFNICTLYKNDKYALITSNDRKSRKLYNLSKDPNWNENIADDNPDIYNQLFNEIKKDAKNQLLLENYKATGPLKDWYLTIERTH